jgi:hypothetical protein
MKATNYLVFFLAGLTLLACSPDNDAKTKTKLFEEQRNALDKAKGVDNIIQQQAKELQQNTEKNTQ